MSLHWEALVAGRVFLAAALSVAFWGTLRAQPMQQSSAGTLSEAIGTFKHEKDAAEQYAVILSTVAKSDTVLYLRGFKLYADAKSDFEGLIAELRFDLVNGQDLATSAKFNETLKGAAEKRVAFTSFVSGEIDKLQGARPGLPDVITAVPKLVTAISEAGLSIWKAYHDAGKERRDAIMSELDHLEWRSFAELAKP
jgi:hypothetical protein